MILRLMLAAAPLLLAIPTPSRAQQTSGPPAVTPEQMRRHIEVLASDAYEGRKPGTEGENKTLLYIATQLQRLGLEPAAGNGSWYQQVGLVQRRLSGHRAIWSAGGKPISMDGDNLILVGREPTEQLRDAPIIFVGHGAVLGEKNIDQLSGADLKGAVVLMLYSAPKQSGFPAFSERAKAAVAAGASAVIAIFGNDVPWSAVQASYREAPDRLQSEPVASIQGGLPSAAAASLVNQSGSDFEQLVSSAADAGFRAVPLNARATFDVSTFVRRYNSHNVIGRLRGTGNTGESVLYLGHWDHLGICRPEGAKDRICNGAVDNASGIAMMIEAARHLARAPRPERDILFLATTAEEMGLLGAEYFGANPVVPLKSIVAAVNMDTVAITPKGEPVATIGRGTTPMDPLIEATARELGRRVDTDTEANVMIQRQDGWALARAGVPTVMVGGGFSDMKKLQAYLAGPYHKPEDDLDASIDLSGAVEDTDLLIALGRKLANPKQYRPAAR